MELGERNGSRKRRSRWNRQEVLQQERNGRVFGEEVVQLGRCLAHFGRESRR